VLWVGWLGSYLVRLRELPLESGGGYGTGATYVWLALALTWGCDTAAYAAGSLWGRHKLFERVSPNKSVEGALGGLAACLAMACLARAWFAPFLGRLDVIVLGLGVGVVSQLGDFVESMVKRDMGVKDASRVIPGHGGVLDRFDGLFFSAPLVYLYLRFAVLS
jgi:phosphatidate cytidylyltransferase